MFIVYVNNSLAFFLEHVIKKKMPSVVLYHYGGTKVHSRVWFGKIKSYIVGMIDPSVQMDSGNLTTSFD